MKMQLGQFAVVMTILLASCNTHDVPDLTTSGVFATDEAWSFNTSERIISTPAWNTNQVFVRTTNSIMSLGLTSGEQLWSSESFGKSSTSYPPLATDEIVLVPEKDGSVAAFDAQNGTLIWRQCNICEEYAEVSSMAISNSIVFVARRNDGLSAYNLQDGSLLWRIARGYRTLPQVVTADGIVYLGGNRLFEAYDGTSGSLLWEHEFSQSLGRLTVVDNTLYAVVAQSQTWAICVLAFDLISQSNLWIRSYQSSNILMNHYIIFDLDTLFVTGGNGITAMDTANGDTLWSELDEETLERPTSLDEVIYVRGRNNVYAVEVATGQIIGESELLTHSISADGSAAEIDPIAVEDYIIVPVDDYWIYAYSAP